MKSSPEQQLTPRTEAALQHLRRLRPLDGYSVDRYLASNGKYLVRLKRRNVPLRDEGFIEIVATSSAVGKWDAGSVVGIEVLTSNGDVGRGSVLVDKSGKVCNNASDGNKVTVQMKKDTLTTRLGESTSTTTSRNSTSSSRRNNTTAIPDNPREGMNNELLIQYGFMATGAVVVLKIIVTAFNFLSILMLPLLYFYACQNCPSNDTFDAKRELKRVMRGAHLPEEQQPKGFFEQGLNRLAASITTEVATSLGYELTITECFGAAKLSSVRVPVAGFDYYWVGVLGKWRYVGQWEIPGLPKRD